MTTLLLVEDDAKITLAMGIRLKAAGYTVATAPDAFHAMSQARHHEPDVVLMDINLPDGDGFTVAQKLQLMPETATTPIIFMTASKAPDLKERANSLNAAAFLEKPFTASQLIDAIESAISCDESLYKQAVR